MAKRTKFKPQSPDSQRNPNSLRFLLKIIREEYAKLEQGELAEKLNAVGRNFGAPALTRHSINKLERGREYIHYRHLEKYAEFVGIPSGLLLLFSRMLANERDNNRQEDNVELAAKIIAVMRRVNRSGALNAKELGEWAAKELGEWAKIFDRRTLFSGKPKT